MSAPCRHAKNAAAFIAGRAVVGRLKYGHTLADADLSSAELVRHAREEAADLLVYLTALEASMVKPEPARPAVTRDAVMQALVSCGAAECSREYAYCSMGPQCTCKIRVDAIMALIGGAP